MIRDSNEDEPISGQRRRALPLLDRNTELTVHVVSEVSSFY